MIISAGESLLVDTVWGNAATGYISGTIFYAVDPLTSDVTSQEYIGLLTASGDYIYSGGLEVVDLGGLTTGDTIYYSGSETIEVGGSAYATHVSSGGLFWVGGAAEDTIVYWGGKEEVWGEARRPFSVADGRS